MQEILKKIILAVQIIFQTLSKKVSEKEKISAPNQNPQNYEDTPWMKIFEQDLHENWNEKSPGDNAKIVECFKLTGYGSLSDETPWCGVYVGRTLIKAGFKPPPLCAYARHYSAANYGTTLKEPKVGCIVNVERNASGGDSHVGFLLGWTKDTIRIGGGNQSNKVTDTLILPRSSVLAFKMPPK